MSEVAGDVGGWAGRASRRRAPTRTSAFGTSRRESHDASAFYGRFVAPEISTDDRINAPGVLDAIICGDAREMDEVPDGSVALVVTSPPYFAGKEYEQALGEGHVPASYVEYLGMLTDVFAECRRVLEPGGRIAVNVANLGRRPWRSLAADVIGILSDRLRMLLRGEVIWVKARGASGSCAWGSFRSPTNPVVRDVTERIIIASKGRFDRAVPVGERRRRGLPHEATITRDEFLEATLDVWEIPPASARRVGHPAPFPVELPTRLIELYTFRGDVVLDPFMGSGSTAVAAVRTGRHYIGYDTDPGYVELARTRVARARPTPPPPVVGRLAGGAGAVDVAAAVLEAAGLDPRRNPPATRIAPGLVADLAVTRGERTWWFTVAGGLTTTGVDPRQVCRAAAVAAAAGGSGVVLTVGPPPRAGEAGALLRALTAPGGPVAGAVDVLDPEAPRRLAGLLDERR